VEVVLAEGDAPMTVRAIYENGVFRPIEPVLLAEHAEVEAHIPDNRNDAANDQAILSVLRTSFPSGEEDVAQRHEEHQAQS
jgi:predicted DNA-binding antitoxin AbrB/MazE fold protein